MSVFALTAKTYPAMDKDDENKQFFWHRRFLYTHGCLHTLVGKPYRFTCTCMCKKTIEFCWFNHIKASDVMKNAPKLAKITVKIVHYVQAYSLTHYGGWEIQSVFRWLWIIQNSWLRWIELISSFLYYYNVQLNKAHVLIPWLYALLGYINTRLTVCHYM